MSVLTSPTIISKEVTSAGDTLDNEWLGSWIQPQHLNDDAIRSYSEAFTSSPTNLIVLKNFLPDEAAAGLSKFINDEAEVEPLYGLYSAMDRNPNSIANVTESEWAEAEEQDRFFRLRTFVRLAPQNKLTPNLAMYLQFLSAFKNPKFRRFFEAITGLTFDLRNETYHFYTFKRGDFLAAHNDRAAFYLLAFMLYLSPEWESRFGGILNIVQPGGILRLEPEYNSLVLFNVETQAEHFVSVVDDCAGERGRTAFSGWLHKPSEDTSLFGPGSVL